MAHEDYIKAQKMAQKEFKAATSKGQYPYLPVLDEILSHVQIEKEVSLGVIDIPLDQVVGTSSFGRTQAFASNFMPLLEQGTEFCSKWSYLVEAQIEEGIHDAIKVYEYMNKFYVVEGNKRVSVLKYFDCPTVAAEVTRKVPKRTDDLDNQIYYEFMDFYKVTRINFIQFTKLGSYSSLLQAVGSTVDDVWSDDEYKDFVSFHASFYKAFKAKGGKKLENVTCGDAILFFLSLFPYEESKDMSTTEIKSSLDTIWSEIGLLGKDDSVELLMDPTEDKSIMNSVLGNILPLNGILPSKKKKVAFVYDKAPSASNWIYSHDLGRIYVKDALKDVIETEAFITEDLAEKAEELLTTICKEGFDIIFTVTPQLIKASLKVAAEYPNVKILNCALNSSHNSVRTYYTRMYEAKFLTGILAGAMSGDDKIGYKADYPIYGSTANINAFALGARMVNPRAQIYLAWSSQKDLDIDAYFKEKGVSYISGQDMITPQHENRSFGLYSENDNDSKKNLALPIYDWGKFYEQLIKTINDGIWKSEDTKGNKAINYWWGLSAGVLDVICSNSLPEGTTRLISLIKESICSGNFNPFTGIIKDQNGNIKYDKGETISPEDIMTMNWLVEGIIGSIPTIDELIDTAKPVVMLRGLNVVATDKGGASLL